MQREVLKYLYDIQQQSITFIYEYLSEDVTFEKYTTNKLVKRAVEREFPVYSRAIKQSMHYQFLPFRQLGNDFIISYNN